MAPEVEVCCQSLQNDVNAIGQRGFSCLVAEFEGKYSFRIQGRAVDAASESQRVAQPGCNISLVFQTGVRFCPFCGTNLTEWLRTHPEQAKKLAEASREYLLG